MRANFKFVIRVCVAVCGVHQSRVLRMCRCEIASSASFQRVAADDDFDDEYKYFVCMCVRVWQYPASQAKLQPPFPLPPPHTHGNVHPNTHAHGPSCVISFAWILRNAPRKSSEWWRVCKASEWLCGCTIQKGPTNATMMWTDSTRTPENTHAYYCRAVLMILYGLWTCPILDNVPKNATSPDHPAYTLWCGSHTRARQRNSMWRHTIPKTDYRYCDDRCVRACVLWPRVCETMAARDAVVSKQQQPRRRQTNTHTHPCINVETIIKAVLCLDTEREGTRERERDTAIVKCRDVCLYDGTRAARRKYPPRRHSRVDQRPDNISAHMHIGRKMGVSLAEYRTICGAAAISVFAFWRPLCT